MTAMPPLRSILNDTPATAVDVDWNFQTTEDYIANDVIKRDGSTAMEAPLNLLGPPPSLATHAVTKGYVDSNVIPLGTIWAFAAAVAPAQWALCNGAEHSSTDPIWAPLFAIIGYSFGQNGTNFRLPDLMGRAPIGRYVADSTHTDQGAVGVFGTLGQQGGSRDAILPAHVHAAPNHYHGMKGHTHGGLTHSHYMNHTHDLQNHVHASGVRNGYIVNSAGQPGTTNAVYTPGNSPYLAFDSRQTAVQTSVLPGAGENNTAGPQPNGTGWASRGDYTDNGGPATTWGPNDNATDWGGAADTDSRGVAPANANVQPYTTINYIIRVA